MKATTGIQFLTGIMFVHLTVIAADTTTTTANVPRASVRTAEETNAPTKLEMKVQIIGSKDGNSSDQQEKRLYAEVRNVGETTVLLPTRDIGPMLNGSAGAICDLTFSPDWYLSTRDGFRIPKAKSDLAIVELRPKEAIGLHYLFSDPIPGSVSVRYRVSKEFGERYGVWHGEISSQYIKVK